MQPQSTDSDRVENWPQERREHVQEIVDLMFAAREHIDELAMTFRTLDARLRGKRVP